MFIYFLENIVNSSVYFFFNDTATTEIYTTRHTLSLHDALPIPARRSIVVAALDVGSSKVVCLIGRLRPRGPQQVLTRRSHSIEVIGFGHTVARGTKAGTVVNLVQAEDAIRRAVDAAERMASVEIEAVVLSISSGRPASELFAAEIEIVGSAVSENDIARVLAAGSRHSL